MKSLFQYADYVRERDENKGLFHDHQTILEIAAREILEGFATLEEAFSHKHSELNSYNQEIYPSCLKDAVEFVRGLARK